MLAESQQPSRRTIPLYSRGFFRKFGAGYLFILPAVILYTLFVLYPFFGSVYLSLTKWDGANPIKEFIGLENYARLLVDRLLWLSLSHNIIWMVVGTIVPISIGLILAILLWNKPRGYSIFRTVFFMPQVLSMVIIGIIWGWIYNPIFGILNRGLRAIGLENLTRSWLAETDLALFAVLAAVIWSSIGFFFVIFLAGLQNVDTELIDAAKIDGANNWQRFWHVIIPQLANIITLVTALSLIDSFRVFDIIFVMTQGGPANSTEVIATYMYTKAFQESQVGYAAALSMILTILSLVTAVVFIRVREREA